MGGGGVDTNIQSIITSLKCNFCFSSQACSFPRHPWGYVYFNKPTTIHLVIQTQSQELSLIPPFLSSPISNPFFSYNCPTSKRYFKYDHLCFCHNCTVASLDYGKHTHILEKCLLIDGNQCCSKGCYISKVQLQNVTITQKNVE